MGSRQVSQLSKIAQKWSRIVAKIAAFPVDCQIKMGDLTQWFASPLKTNACKVLHIY